MFWVFRIIFIVSRRMVRRVFFPVFVEYFSVLVWGIVFVFFECLWCQPDADVGWEHHGSQLPVEAPEVAVISCQCQVIPAGTEQWRPSCT